MWNENEVQQQLVIYALFADSNSKRSEILVCAKFKGQSWNLFITQRYRVSSYYVLYNV